MIPVIVYVSFLMILGVFGNSMVMYFYRCKTKMKPNACFIVALTIFDLFTCVLGMPMDLAEIILSLDCNATKSCKVLRLITYFTTIASALILVSLAIDRYRRICQPLKNQLSVRQVIIVCIVCAFISALLSWPVLVLYDVEQVTDQMNITLQINGTAQACQISTSKSDILYVRALHILHVICFVTLTITLFMIYALIVRQLLNVKRRSSTFAISYQRRRQNVPMTYMSFSVSRPITCYSDMADLQNMTDDNNLHKIADPDVRLDSSHKINTDAIADHEEIMDIKGSTYARECRSALLKYRREIYRTKNAANLNSDGTKTNEFSSSRNTILSWPYQMGPENENKLNYTSVDGTDQTLSDATIDSTRILRVADHTYKSMKLSSGATSFEANNTQHSSSLSNDVASKTSMHPRCISDNEGRHLILAFDYSSSSDFVSEPTLFQENDTLHYTSSQSTHVASKTTQPKDDSNKARSPLLRTEPSRIQTKFSKTISVAISNPSHSNSHEIGKMNTRVAWSYQPCSLNPNNSKCISKEDNDETLSDAMVNSTRMQRVADARLASRNLASKTPLCEENNTQLPFSQRKHVSSITLLEPHDASLTEDATCSEETVSKMQTKPSKIKSASVLISAQIHSQEMRSQMNTRASWPYHIHSANAIYSKSTSTECTEKTPTISIIGTAGTFRVPQSSHISRGMVSEAALLQENSTQPTSSQLNCASRQSGCQRIQSPMGTIHKGTIVILFVIPLVFVLSFMPYLSLSVWISFQDTYEVDSFTDSQLVACKFGLKSYLINCSVNPLIYGLFNSEFRKFIYRKLVIRCQNFLRWILQINTHTHAQI